MPNGELFFKSSGISASSDSTGVQDGWADAYVRYGISFTDTALSSLMTPAPNKLPVENKSRLQHGKRVARRSDLVLKDEREVSVEMHLTASSRALFWYRYAKFCKEILDCGFFEIYHRDIYIDPPQSHALVQQSDHAVFRVSYEDCQQFSEFIQEMAKFTLRLSEPDPTNRAWEDRWSQEVQGEVDWTPMTRPDIDDEVMEQWGINTEGRVEQQP